MKKKYVVGVRIPGEFFEFKTKKDSEEFIKEVKKKDKRLEIITAITNGGY